MMYGTGKRKPKATDLQTQVIFDLPHHIDMVLEELAFNDTKLYTVVKWIAAHLNIMAVSRFVRQSPGSLTRCHNQLSYLHTPSISLVDHYRRCALSN